MRDWTEVDCPHALECFTGGLCGKGAFVDEESGASGGRPYAICSCMTEQEHFEAQEANSPLPMELMVSINQNDEAQEDLDDVAARSPKAKAELEALREQVRRLEQELEDFRSQHTHDCIRCRHQYTPKEGESEDCPVCGCDGALETCATILTEAPIRGRSES